MFRLMTLTVVGLASAAAVVRRKDAIRARASFWTMQRTLAKRAHRRGTFHVALVRVGPENPVAERIRDPVPVMLVLEMVQPMVAPYRAVPAVSGLVGGVDQE